MHLCCLISKLVYPQSFQSTATPALSSQPLVRGQGPLLKPHVPCESPSRPLRTGPRSTPALSYLNSHLPPLSLAHWVDLFLACGGFWHLSVLASHPYSSRLLCHLVTSEFTQTHQLACRFLLIHCTLWGSQALSTSGHKVAWVMAQYFLADSEVGMWRCWGVHSVVVGRGSSRLSTSAQSLFRVLGNGLWFRTPGLVCMAPDPEHSDLHWVHLGPTPAVRAVSSQLVCGLRKAVQFH